MKSIPQQNLESTGADPDIQSELIRIIYSSVPLTLTAVLLNSAILSVVQWDYIDHNTILIWFAITNGLSLLRLSLYKKFKTLDAEQPVPAVWEHIALISSVASGITWGAVAIWLFPQTDIAHQVFPAFVLAGMCAGAVTTLSPILKLLIVFVVFSMLPLFGRFLIIDTDVTYAMAIMAAMFAGMILIAAKRFNLTMRESLLIRHEQQLAKEIIEHQAFYDSLTGLPNRRLLSEKLKQEINRSIRHKHIGAVLFLDLDHFKMVNDSLGHAVGDELLQQVAQRIKQRLRDEDTTARLGGDEFIILISDAGDELSDGTKNVRAFAEQVLCLFEQPFDVHGHTINITASIGIALFPLAETTPDELLQKSDVAMYEAKDAGRNKMRLFLPEMQQTLHNQREIEKGLHQALAEDGLELFYQPLFDADNNIFAIEALLRWNHPDKGIVPPSDFIEIAEKRGLIVPIGDWVLKQACKQLMQMPETNNLTMCINVSPRQFKESSFVDKLKKVLTETGVNPKNIRLEITEGMVLENIDKTIEKMKILTADGIRFSIDDFGTGYSSLAYLKRLPVDLLKIDKSFVLDIDRDPNDAIIVETIIVMAQHMQIGVVAEGVETQQILDFLKSKGCRKFQGYLFERPIPFVKLLNLIKGDAHKSVLINKGACK